MNIGKVIIQLLSPLRSKNRAFKSYSAYGEDAMLKGIFRRLNWLDEELVKGNKTYLDIGSYHPKRASNTYFLYKEGWCGTLVEPNSFYRLPSKLYRRKDYFVNASVSTESGITNYYEFSIVGSSNTTNPKFAEKIAETQCLALPDPYSVTSLTLAELMELHQSRFGQFPFVVDVDIEGNDHVVVNQIQRKWNVPFIIIEDVPLGVFRDSQIRQTMEAKGYHPIATNFLSTIYVDKFSTFYNLLN